MINAKILTDGKRFKIQVWRGWWIFKKWKDVVVADIMEPMFFDTHELAQHYIDYVINDRWKAC